LSYHNRVKIKVTFLMFPSKNINFPIHKHHIMIRSFNKVTPVVLHPDPIQVLSIHHMEIPQISIIHFSSIHYVKLFIAIKARCMVRPDRRPFPHSLRTPKFHVRQIQNLKFVLEKIHSLLSDRRIHLILNLLISDQ